jgi:hypothetical protein
LCDSFLPFFTFLRSKATHSFREVLLLRSFLSTSGASRLLFFLGPQVIHSLSTVWTTTIIEVFLELFWNRIRSFSWTQFFPEDIIRSLPSNLHTHLVQTCAFERFYLTPY